MRKYYLILCCTFIVNNLIAQLDNSPFYQQNKLDSPKVNKLYFQFGGLGFVKNNEFSNPIISGRTFFGYQLTPKISYQISEFVMLDIGAFLWKDFGNEEYSDIASVFTLKYQKNSFSMIFGNLEGNLTHQLIEPLYNFENVISNNQEFGLQFLYNDEKTSLDLWVDWQKMIYQGSDEQEEISGGVNYKRLIFGKPVGSKLEAIVQANLLHKGGEIDVSPAPAFTHLNYALGLRYIFKPNKNVIKSIILDNYYVGHTNELDTVRFKSGKGWYLNFTAKTKYLDLVLSYWNGDDYVSSIGGDLYNSLGKNFDNMDFTERKREVVFLRILKDFQLDEEVKLSARFEPNYDLNNETFEFTMGLYLNFKLDFLISDKVKK